MSLLADVDPRKSRNGMAILSVGDDHILLGTRQMVLEAAGYEVCSVPSRARVEDYKITHIDLAVICHSVDPLQTTRITCALREANPSLPILLLAPICGDSRDSFACVSAFQDGPQGILDKIHDMLIIAAPQE